MKKFFQGGYLVYKRLNYFTAICFLLFAAIFHSCYAVLSTNNRDTQVDFLAIADIHLDTTFYGPDETMEFNPSKISKGSPRKNDMDQATFELMLDTIRSNIDSPTTGVIEKKPEFILVLGDVASHNRSVTPPGSNIAKDEEVSFTLLREKFPDIPMFYVFGNNDGLKAVNGLFHEVKGVDLIENSSEETLVNIVHSPGEIATGMGGWLSPFLSSGVSCKDKMYPCINLVVRRLGFFVAYIRPKLKIIAINSMLYSAKPNNPSAEKLGEMQTYWLRSQLRSSQKENGSVIIVSHLPFGNSTFEGGSSATKGFNYLREKDQQQLYELIKEYKDTVIAVLFAHVHYEDLKLIDKTAGNNLKIAYGIPGMSTSDGNSPGIKMFHLASQQNKWILTDYDTLSFKKENNGSVILKTLYNAREYYCGDKNTANAVALESCFSKENLVQKFKENYTLGNFKLEPEDRKTVERFINEENLIIILGNKILSAHTAFKKHLIGYVATIKTFFRKDWG